MSKKWLRLEQTLLNKSWSTLENKLFRPKKFENWSIFGKVMKQTQNWQVFAIAKVEKWAFVTTGWPKSIPDVSLSLYSSSWTILFLWSLLWSMQFLPREATFVAKYEIEGLNFHAAWYICLVAKFNKMYLKSL